jgi:hypothetical protein
MGCKEHDLDSDGACCAMLCLQSAKSKEDLFPPTNHHQPPARNDQCIHAKKKSGTCILTPPPVKYA